MTDKPKQDRGYEAAVDEFARVIGRAPETPSTRVVRRPAPTLEDVDAELAPKGLQVIELDGPAWVGSWQEVARDVWRRTLLADYPLSPTTWTCQVQRNGDGTWDATRQGYPPADDRGCYGHPTPEAAQQACEAAIVAAWRNR